MKNKHCKYNTLLIVGGRLFGVFTDYSRNGMGHALLIETLSAKTGRQLGL
ncbi:hypothetical protein [Methylobacter sp.]